MASVTLGFVMAGHVALETGVDALFLANISVERLPLVTIAIAFLALLASRARIGRDHRGSLIVLQCIAGLGTLAMWSLVALANAQNWVFYVLYLWSGLITSMIVVRFWLFLGDLFTIIEGKRLFASIAMGGSVGALVGSGSAALIAQYLAGESLLVASSVFFTMSLVGPCFFLASKESDGPGRMPEEDMPRQSLVASFQTILGNPYAVRVAGLLAIGGITLTLGDYLFKSVVAEEVAVDQLAVMLSRVYLGLNLLSISMLAIGVTPLIRRLGVDRSLAVLPAAIGVAGLGVLAGGALAATIFLKAADGTLRYSLHKTTSELLFLPMSSGLRSSVKGVIDIVGQAGAKAFGSLIILALVLGPHPRMLVAGAVVVFAAVWVVASLRLRSAYLDNFRETLGEGLIETAIEYPELDLDSAGSLIRALSDPDERRALAAMRLLVERDQVSLIPSLVLYHPSASVVAYALDVFALARRDDLLHLFDHLLDHEAAVVRAATVRASSVLERDATRLHGLLDSECLVIRLSAVAGLIALGEDEADRYSRLLEEAIDYEDSDPRLAAATAARLEYRPLLRDSLMRFAQDDDEEVARESIRAIRESEDGWYTAPLVGLLGDRRIREDVRDALIERQLPALAVLEFALTNPETPFAVLRHIPRTIARFGSEEAADVLVSSLSSVSNGMIRYKVLRGLEMLLLGRGMPRPFVRIGKGSSARGRGIRDEFDRTLARSLDLLHLQVALTRVHARESILATAGGKLLVELLEDKQELAKARLFSMLGLLHPSEDYRAIQSGLESASVTDRASAAELVETLLPNDVSRTLLGIAAPSTPQRRLELADPEHAGLGFELSELISRLLTDDSGSVREVALYYVEEAGLGQYAGDRPTQTVDDSAPTERAHWNLRDRAASILRNLSEDRVPRSSPVAAATGAKR